MVNCTDYCPRTDTHTESADGVTITCTCVSEGDSPLLRWSKWQWVMWGASMNTRVINTPGHDDNQSCLQSNMMTGWAQNKSVKCNSSQLHTQSNHVTQKYLSPNMMEHLPLKRNSCHSPTNQCQEHPMRGRGGHFSTPHLQSFNPTNGKNDVDVVSYKNSLNMKHVHWALETRKFCVPELVSKTLLA